MFCFFCEEQHGALQILYKGACPLPKAHPLKNYDDSVCELPQQLNRYYIFWNNEYGYVFKGNISFRSEICYRHCLLQSWQINFTLLSTDIKLL